VGQYQGYRKFAASAAQLSLIFAEGWSGEGLIRRPWIVAQEAADATEHLKSMEIEYQCLAVRDIFGNPFRPITADPKWLTSAVVGLAQAIYDERAFDRLPILGDALEESGCDVTDVLEHCRQPGEHVRGCWVVDLLLNKT
jgi:hypothetical protein